MLDAEAWFGSNSDMENVPPAENVFSFDRANQVINSLLLTVKSQSAAIKRLESLSSSSVGSGDLAVALSRLDRRLDDLSLRLDRVEHGIDLKCRDPSSVGFAASEARRTVAASMAIVTDKADERGVAERLEASRLLSDKRLRALEEKLASKDSLDATLQLLDGQSERLKFLEVSLSRKVDVDNIAKLELAAKSIFERAADVRKQSERLSFLEQSLQEHGSRIGVAETLGSRATATLQLLHERLSHSAHADDVKTLEAQVKALGKSVANDVPSKGDHDSLKMLVANHGRTIKTLSSVSSSLVENASRLEKTVTDHSSNKASKSELSKILSNYALAAAVNSAVDRISLELSHKTPLDFSRNLSQRLDALTASHTVTSKTASIGARFVDWYGKRGDVYEHNLSAVDSHLRHLAVKAHTKSGGETAESDMYYDEDDPDDANANRGYT